MPDPTGEVLRAWLAVVGSQLDRRTLTEILRDVVDPRELTEATDADLARRFGLGPDRLPRLRRGPSPRELQQQLDLMDRHRIALLPLGDPGYPRNLFALRIPPPALFVKGRLHDEDALAIGIVGPRDPSPYGTDVTRRLTHDFAAHFTIVSGAAMGIDSIAHQTALDRGGRTIAVLGCGIDQNYPAMNAALRRRIAEDGQGALVSTFPPGTRPLRGHFPQRNVVLAGLCLAVVVTEASTISGALVTARSAAEEGRPVYAVPGDITRPTSAGANMLLREGASVCTGATDIIADLEGMLKQELELLRQRRRAAAPASEAPPAASTPRAPAPLPSEPPVRPRSAQPPTGDTPAENAILARLHREPAHHDDLIDQFVPAAMTLGELSSALLLLEIKGTIEQRPGRIYATT